MHEVPRLDIESRLRHWMFDVALPYWSTSGIEPGTGRFVEHFSLSGEPYCETRRVFVICRQIYVFCHAAELGWTRGDAIAARAYEILVAEAWLGPRKGWARRLGAHGGAVDETPDLYVEAFVLFALAWYYKRSRDPGALGHIERTFAYLDEYMRHPSGIGFWHELPGTGPRLQNPHMHLMEAALALIEFCDNAQARALANEIVELFETQFYDARSGTLAEYFDDDFRRLPTPEGRMTEPGHQFEWAWILSRYQRLRGGDVAATVRGLIDFAERRGVDPADRRTYNVVRDDGVVLDAGSRAWPNAERIKAAVAMQDLFGRDPRPVITESGALLLDRYLAREPAGTWIDRFDALGAIAVDKVPASNFYHVFLAFAEALRGLEESGGAARMWV